MGFQATCACCGQFKNIIYAKTDASRRLCFSCWRDHREDYREGSDVRQETQSEWLARLAKKIEAAPPPPPVALPPPKEEVGVIVQINGKPITPKTLRDYPNPRAAATRVQTPAELEKIRQTQKKIMNANRAKYYPKRSGWNLTQ